ncbi:glycosyltransferase [Patescibacteria group bacterium]|nr:glycosyltransferase [Patescibacteria group bacterium]
MRVLSIGSDPNIFDKDSVSAKRMIGYGEMVERYDILARAPKGQKDVVLSPKVHVFALPAKTPIHAVFGAMQRFWMLRRVGHWDVVTAQDPFDSGLAGWILARLLGAAFHVQVHGDFFGSVHWKKERLLNRLLFPLACFLARRADAVRAVSETVRDGLIAHGVVAERVMVSRITPSTVETTTQGVHHSNHFPSLLWVGRFEKEKNPLLALRAFVLAREKDPVVMAHQTLGFVGQGSLREEIEKEIERCGLGGVVFVEPWTKTPLEYYRKATILLLTSNHEGWGRVIEEAGQSSLPVIMTGVGGAEELVRDGETGSVVPVGDAVALAEKMLFALSDRERLAGIGKALGQVIRALPDAEVMKRLLYQSWESAVTHFQETTKPALHRLHSLLLIALVAHAFMFFAFLFRFGTGGQYGWYVLGSDDVVYLQLGKNIWHGVFSRVAAPPFTPEHFRTPLYPLFLSLLRFFPAWLLITVQQACAVAGILCWYVLARRFGSVRVAWWSAVLFAVEPTMRFWTAQFATEGFFSLFWFGALLLWARAMEKRTVWSGMIAGVFFGLSVLVRPIAVFYPAVLAVTLWYAPFRFWKSGLHLLFGLGIGMAFCVLPWSFRNQTVFGTLRMTSMGTAIQWGENAPTYLMWKNGISREAAIAELAVRLSIPEVVFPRDTASVQGVLDQLFWADPFGFSFVMAKSAIPYFLGDGYMGVLKVFVPTASVPSARWDGDVVGYIQQVAGQRYTLPVLSLSLLGKCISIATSLFACVGMLAYARRRTLHFVLVWWVLSLFYFAATSSTIAYSRYRYPIQPLLFFFAVSGIMTCTHMLSFFQKKKTH